MQFDHEYANFDPYNIFGSDIGASNAEIKTAYKTKALVYHPDKETGDEILFMNLTKAYKALTDATAKRNWEHLLMMLAHAGQISKMPHLFSLENNMKLCPMIVQALWEHKNPLLQLPHIDEDILKYINSKYYVKTLDKLVRLDEVLGNKPLVNIQIIMEFIDDEETNVITAGALVAASVFLSRKSFSSLMNMEGISTITSVQLNEPKIMKEEVKEEKEGDKKKTSIWKPKSKSIKRGAGKKTSKKFSRRNNFIKLPLEQISEENKEDKKKSVTPEIKVKTKKQTKQNQSNKGSQIEDDIMNLDASISQDEDSENEEGAKDDEDWDKFQNPFNKRQKFKDFTLDVKRAPDQPKNHPQYNFSWDDDEKREAPEFEYATDTDETAVIDDSDHSLIEDAEN
ncbi:hypothetical protein QYM36_013707 [Artemia franciscana]|uniref:J domain-containing protein n=1 Tax=Artemia franciscana TaxID=6661 RepID=A0AA88HF06_ARTSF|nr:hypothetical protein QYM36_013707 [Artemia franciscana]